MRISYKFGGFFQIRRVKWDMEGQMFLDYAILIDSISDPEQYRFLRDLHLQQQREAENPDIPVKSWIERKKISAHLCGLARVL